MREYFAHPTIFRIIFNNAKLVLRHFLELLDLVDDGLKATVPLGRRHLRLRVLLGFLFSDLLLVRHSNFTFNDLIIINLIKNDEVAHTNYVINLA